MNLIFLIFAIVCYFSVGSQAQHTNSGSTAAFPTALCVDSFSDFKYVGDYIYMHTDTNLVIIEKSTNSILWTTENKEPIAGIYVFEPCMAVLIKSNNSTVTNVIRIDVYNIADKTNVRPRMNLPVGLRSSGQLWNFVEAKALDQYVYATFVVKVSSATDSNTPVCQKFNGQVTPRIPFLVRIIKIDLSRIESSEYFVRTEEFNHTYITPKSFYIVSQAIFKFEPPKTIIHKFKINEGKLTPVKQIQIIGTIVEKSLNEYIDNRLRMLIVIQRKVNLHIFSQSLTLLSEYKGIASLTTSEKAHPPHYDKNIIYFLNHNPPVLYVYDSDNPESFSKKTSFGGSIGFFLLNPFLKRAIIMTYAKNEKLYNLEIADTNVQRVIAKTLVGNNTSLETGIHHRRHGQDSGILYDSERRILAFPINIPSSRVSDLYIFKVEETQLSFAGRVGMSQPKVQLIDNAYSKRSIDTISQGVIIDNELVVKSKCMLRYCSLDSGNFSIRMEIQLPCLDNTANQIQMVSAPQQTAMKALSRRAAATMASSPKPAAMEVVVDRVIGLLPGS